MYVNSNTIARQQAAKKWMDLQRARYQELQMGQTGKQDYGAGGASAASESRQRAQFASSARGQQLQKMGGNAFEIGFRNKFYGGYRRPADSSLNSEKEFQLYMEMTGQKNPYTSGGGQQTTTRQITPQAQQGQQGQPGDPMFDFLGSYRDQLNAANAANEQRYHDINQGYDERYQRSTDLLKGMGDYQLARAKEAAGESAGIQQAAFSGRGVGDRAANVNARAARDLEMKNMGIMGQTAQMLAQNDARLSQDKLAFMERRTDQQPDYGQMLALAEKYGQGNGGQGFVPDGPVVTRNGQMTPAQYQQPLRDLMKEPVLGSAVLGGQYQYPRMNLPLPKTKNKKKKPTRGVPYQSPKVASGEVVDPNSYVDYQEHNVVKPKRKRRSKRWIKKGTQFIG